MGSSGDSQWSDDRPAEGGWSSGDNRDNAGGQIGTWENPRQQQQANRPSLKPLRNEEVRSNWSRPDESESGWDSQSTPTKDWANSSAGSEISPGSAWKKDTHTVGNWADDVSSPRDREENPLDASLKEARRSLSNW